MKSLVCYTGQPKSYFIHTFGIEKFIYQPKSNYSEKNTPKNNNQPIFS